MGRVSGKTCIVTGASMGLGRADALLLAAEGARVVLTDIETEQGHELAREIGEQAIFIHHDVRDARGWKRIVQQAVETFGGIDVLVNNAGVIDFKDIEHFELADWRRVFEVSVYGALWGCQAAIPAMCRSDARGSIINLSSTAALSGMVMIPAYSAAKGALRALTRSVAAYCAAKHYAIRCNALHPTTMDTPMVARAIEALRSFVPEGQQANGTRPGSPSEVANAVLYLASDESLPVNGSSLVLDRGTTIMEGVAP